MRGDVSGVVRVDLDRPEADFLEVNEEAGDKDCCEAVCQRYDIAERRSELGRIQGERNGVRRSEEGDIGPGAVSPICDEYLHRGLLRGAKRRVNDRKTRRGEREYQVQNIQDEKQPAGCVSFI